MTSILEENHIEYYNNLSYGLELSVRKNSNGKYLFVFNNSDEYKTFEAKVYCESILNQEIQGMRFDLKPFGVEVLKL